MEGILSDGRIIAFGNSGGYFAFTRYTTTGALDTTFDTDGKLTLIQNITTPTAILATTIRSLPKLIILSDDKFIVSGTSDNDYKVIKLFNDGYVTSFGTYGSVTVNDNIDVSSFLLEKSNGNLITGGYSSNTSTDYKIKKIELYNNGYTLTTNYLSLILSYEEPPSRGNIIKLVDGSYIIPIGINPNVFSGNLSLIKILADGNRDMTFGNAGNVELDYYNYEGGLILLPDGKIIVRHSTKLYKMDLNGILDTSFGVGGIVDFTTIGNGQLRYIDDFILSNDNKLLLACDYNISPSKIITAVVKLNLDGSLDNTFGINGVVNYGFNPNAPSNYSEYPSTLVQDANNKIVVASISSTSNFNNTNIYFSKLNADGSSDSTFGSNGIYTYTTLLNNTYPKKICVTSDNNYLVSYSNYNITTKSNTLKINTNGGIYNSFGINGLVEESDLSLYRDMLIQPDNKILKGGYKNRQFSTIRYNSDGSLDSGFGINGEVNSSIGSYSEIYDLSLQTNGQLIATGVSFNIDRQLITMARYTDLNLGTLDLNSSKNSILVYPNPIEKEATFQYTLQNNKAVSIELVDVQGKVVQNIITNQNQNAGLQLISLTLNDSILTGNYFLKITSSKGSQAVQIIKK